MRRSRARIRTVFHTHVSKSERCVASLRKRREVGKRGVVILPRRISSQDVQVADDPYCSIPCAVSQHVILAVRIECRGVGGSTKAVGQNGHILEVCVVRICRVGSKADESMFHARCGSDFGGAICERVGWIHTTAVDLIQFTCCKPLLMTQSSS